MIRQKTDEERAMERVARTEVFREKNRKRRESRLPGDRRAKEARQIRSMFGGGFGRANDGLWNFLVIGTTGEERYGTDPIEAERGSLIRANERVAS